MNSKKYFRNGALALLLFAAACGPKRVAAPPPPPPQPLKQNVFVLLPERDGRPSSIEVRNQAGAQDLNQPYQAVRVERADVAPGAPFAMDQAEVRRLFGAAIDALPTPEVPFALHFAGDSDVLNAESVALIPLILRTIRDRRSTAITVIGHTDTTAAHDYNYRLGLRRAQAVSLRLQNLGVNASDLFVSSHGDADLVVQTGPGKDNAENRRVEVIVR